MWKYVRKVIEIWLRKSDNSVQRNILFTKNASLYLLHGAESFLSSLVLQLVKKFPTFYGTRKFITVLTSARHLSLSW